MIPVPCPSCSDLPLVEHKSKAQLFRVRCINDKCQAGPLTVWQRSRDHAIAVWNGTDDVETLK